MPYDQMLQLRELQPADELLRERLSSSEVAGEWNTFDEDSTEFISGRQYNGGMRIADSAGLAVGSMSFIRIPYGPNRRSLAWRIGIAVLTEHRGRGIGATAQRLLAVELLTSSDANRVEADTDVDNVAEQRALAKAGFVREGILRSAQWRRGAWRDSVLYSLLRTDL